MAVQDLFNPLVGLGKKKKKEGKECVAFPRVYIVTLETALPYFYLTKTDMARNESFKRESSTTKQEFVVYCAICGIAAFFIICQTFLDLEPVLQEARYSDSLRISSLLHQCTCK